MKITKSEFGTTKNGSGGTGIRQDRPGGGTGAL